MNNVNEFLEGKHNLNVSGAQLLHISWGLDCLSRFYKAYPELCGCEDNPAVYYVNEEMLDSLIKNIGDYIEGEGKACFG